jgi:hypothetical protein
VRNRSSLLAGSVPECACSRVMITEGVRPGCQCGAGVVVCLNRRDDGSTTNRSGGFARRFRHMEVSMDPKRFDALARTFGGSKSRRGVIGMLAGIAGLAAGRGVVNAQAYTCGDQGCACPTGTYQPCNAGLVCCPLLDGMAGGPGVCMMPNDCGGSCIASGDACGDVCGWDSTCSSCCTGYCNSVGYCGPARCSGLGCACATGTYMPCDPGLSCCSSYPGMPGAQGTCQYGCPDDGMGAAPVGSSMQ